MEPASDIGVPRSRWITNPKGRRLWVAVAIAAVVLLVGIGVAVAQSGSSPSTTAPSTQTPGNGGTPKGRMPGGRMRGPAMMFGGGLGAGGAIHGEFVTPDGNGGYRTIDEQRGDVTAVSSSSITVKSADGFSKTYSVDQNTLVNAGRDGIGSVKTGDTVTVTAAVEGSTAHAMNVLDATTTGNIRNHWGIQRPLRPGGAPTTTTPGSA